MKLRKIQKISFRLDMLLTITLGVVIISYLDGALIQTPLFAHMATEKGYGIFIFGILVAASIFSQLFFLYKTRLITRSQKTKKTFVYRLTWISVISGQVLVNGILVLVMFQISIVSIYDVSLISVLVGTSLILGLFIFCVLIAKMINWCRSNPNKTVVIYLVAIILLTSNLVSMTFWWFDLERVHPAVISSMGCGLTCMSQVSIFAKVYSISYIISFLAIWLSSVMLIRNFYHKIKGRELWMLVVIPLVLLLIRTNGAALDYFIDLFHFNLILKHSIYTILQNIIGPLAGVMAGLVFWYMARNLNQPMVRNHIMLIAYGTLLLLSLNETPGFEILTFPPYGIISSSFIPIASFSIMLGVYFSAVYVAQDSKLRSSLVSPNSPISKELSFFANLGTSENRQQTLSNMSRVIKKVAKNMESESGVPMDSEENIQDYVNLALKEIKKFDQRR